MATPRTTVSAVPDAPTSTPPAADTGAGTSDQSNLLDQLTGDDTEHKALPAPTPTPAAAPAQSMQMPGAATVTVTPAPIAASQPGPRLITKVDEYGNEQALPQAAWDALGAANLAKFTDVPTQPEKPASLI